MHRTTPALAGLVVAALLAPASSSAEQHPAGARTSAGKAAAAVAVPDLKVKVMLEKKKIDNVWRVRMAYRVYNVGAAPAGPSTVGSWCLSPMGGPCPPLDGAYQVDPPVEPGATGVVRLATPPIPPGASVVVPGPQTRPWPNGSYTIRARADFLDVVHESIENNNSGQAVIAIP